MFDPEAVSLLQSGVIVSYTDGRLSADHPQDVLTRPHGSLASLPTRPLLPSIEEESLDDREKVKPVSLVLLSALFFTVVGKVMAAPALTDVVYMILCARKKIAHNACFGSHEVGTAVAQFSALDTFLSSMLAVVLNAVLMPLSDKVGRRKILLVNLTCGVAAQTVAFVFVTHMGRLSSPYWLLMPGAFDSLGGSLILSVALGVAYVSDKERDQRSRANKIAWVEGIVFLAVAIAPLTGSFLLQLTSFRTLLIVTIVARGIAVVLGILLRESFRPNDTTKSFRSSVVSLKNFKLLLFPGIQPRGRRLNAILLGMCALLGTEFAMSFIGVIVLYPRNSFGWNAVQTGYLISTMAFTRAFCYGVVFSLLYGLLHKLWDVRNGRLDMIDRTMLQLAMGMQALGYLAMGWSRSPSQFVAGAVLDASAGMATPILKSAMLKNVNHDRVGAFLGAFNTVVLLTGTVMPAAFLRLYSWAVWRPFLPFEIVAGLFGLLLLASTWIVL